MYILPLDGKSHRRILAFGLTKSSVAVDWSLCAGLRGSVAAGLCCTSVAVAWSLRVGRCRCCRSIAVGRSL